MLRWLKRLLTWAVLGGVVAGIVYGLLPQPVDVDVEAVTRGPMQVRIEEDGKTRIRDKFIVSSPISGQLQRVKLEPGDSVTAGQTVLAEIEPDLPEVLNERVLAQAEAKVQAATLTADKTQLAEATAAKALENAEKHLTRIQELRKTKAATEEQLDAAELEVTRCKEIHASSKLAASIAKFELEWAKMAVWGARPKPNDPPHNQTSPGQKWSFPLAAPITGQVLRRFQESATVVTPATKIVELGDVRRMEVEVDVLTTDAVKIPEKAEVLFEQWGGANPLHGQVRRIEPAAFTKISALGVEEQRVYVIIDLLDPPEARPTLGDGFRVEARIILWKGDNVIQVPTSALFRVGTDWGVFKIVEGKVQRQIVQVGHRNGITAEILTGLTEHEMVVIHPSDRVAEGAQIKIRGSH